MKQSHFDHYLSHDWRLEVYQKDNHEIIKGELTALEGTRKVPILGGIPRFVEFGNYADNFGLQWNLFHSTQLDSHTDKFLTSKRFWNNTRWNPRELYGKTVLEVGSGAGRFTEILLEAGAKVISFDYSNSVEANWQNNQGKGDLFLFQGDIFNLPLQDGIFDFVFCFGVLQHVHDPDRAYRTLFRKIAKGGGRISIDHYLKTHKLLPWNQPKYFWRRWTSTMDPNKLLRIVRFYVPLWLPLDTIIKKIPKLGLQISALLHIPCYNHLGKGFCYKEREEWAILDTFDALGACYDLPKTLDEVRDMVENSEAETEVFYGSNGVVANSVRK